MGVSPYISAIRRHIGRDLLLVPGVTALVENEAGEVLLVRHADFEGWSTLGGAVEPDEAPAAAAVREVKEEVDLTVEVTGILGVVGGPQFRVVYRNGDEVSYVTTVFSARVIAGNLSPDNDEITAARWFPKIDLRTVGLTQFATQTLLAVGFLPPLALDGPE